MLLLTLSRSVAWLVAYVVVYGLPFGAISPLRASALADHVGRRAYGAISAMQGVPVALAGAAGPLAAGWLYDHLRDDQLAFTLAAATLALAAVAVALTPDPHASKEPAQVLSLGDQ